MATRDNLNHEQLAMFMPARALKARIPDSSDRFDDESMNDMWRRKAGEASMPAGTFYSTPESYVETSHGTGIRDSLTTKGYDGPPINVRHVGAPGEGRENLFINDGHHRVATAAQMNIEVPVNHRDSKSSVVQQKAFDRKSQHDVRLASMRVGQEKRLSASKKLLEGRSL